MISKGFWPTSNTNTNNNNTGRDGSVGITTCYRLERQEIEGGGEIFRTLGAHPTYCTMRTRSFRRVKRPGRGVEYPP
jgi:hypothetical protein